MITIDTLLCLINKYEQVIATSKSFGYINLRIFCPYDENDKDTLNILATFEAKERNRAAADKKINDALKELMDCNVCLWGEGAHGLSEDDYREANEAPLTNMPKVINY